MNKNDILKQCFIFRRISKESFPNKTDKWFSLCASVSQPLSISLSLILPISLYLYFSFSLPLYFSLSLSLFLFFSHSLSLSPLLSFCFSFSFCPLSLWSLELDTEVFKNKISSLFDLPNQLKLVKQFNMYLYILKWINIINSFS